MQHMLENLPRVLDMSTYIIIIIISIYIKESLREVFSETAYRRVMIDGFLDCAPNGECCRLCEVIQKCIGINM